MTLKKQIFSFVLIFTFLNVSFAQFQKFGKIKKHEFETKNESFYKKANAIVLFKNQKTFYEYDSSYGMVIVTKIHERIKILNKEGYEYATKTIDLYSKSTTVEEVEIKANTFNLINGEIVIDKLNKKNIFKKQTDKFWSTTSFTMPNVTEESIVEWKYTIRSPYLYHINDFVFQYDIPIVHFKGKMTFPEQLNARYEYNKNFNLKLKKNNGLEISIDHVEPLTKEPYTNNIENYRGKISFEITESTFRYKKLMQGITSETKLLSNTWDEVTKSIYDSPNFGKELKKVNYFKDELPEIIKDITTKKEKVKAIFKFVKNKIKWNKYYGIFTQDGVKKAYQNGIGNVAEINLILTAMLRESGLDASPILVSTRSHKIPVFPTRKGFNYVICGVELPNEIILLDATNEFTTLNVLPKRVLNWKGRIIRSYGSSAFIGLFPKVYAIDDKRVNIKLNTNGSIKGSIRATYKNLNALNYRDKYNKLSNESLIKNLETAYKNIEINKARLGNETNLEKPYSISFQFSAENQMENINEKLYFSPMFFLGDKENIFKQDNRKYPVDFGTPWLENHEFIIQIPEGYKVEKLPESYEVKADSGNYDFDYTSVIKGDKIIIKVKTKFNVPQILHNEYQELKNFYTQKIQKQNEKIVLVKE